MIIKDRSGNILKKIVGDTLVHADLHGVYLCYANLRSADLRYANLRGAVLQGANLHYADLRGAVLQGAVLQGANLRGADLHGAVLRGAYLQGADLQGAVLQGAVLQGAVLQGANLRGAKTDENTKWPHFQIVPEGNLLVWKKVYKNGLHLLCKLLIPAAAKRTSSLVGRKCRASKAKVLAITSLDQKTRYKKAFSSHLSSFLYEVGKTVSVKDFDPDIKVECTRGIHFFITEKEAIEY